jgi:hypothetical protein
VLEVVQFIASALLSLIAAALAVYMVKRSFDLLQKGVITLRDANPDDAIKVEFKKLITIQTRYPALGFLVLAMICLGIALWARPQFRGIVPMKLTASLNPIAQGVDTAFFEDPDPLGSSEIDSTGRISTEILPRIVKVRIRIPTPGYDPGQITKDLSPDQAKNNVLDFGTFSVGSQDRTKRPDDNPALIDTPSRPLAPLPAAIGSATPPAPAGTLQ